MEEQQFDLFDEHSEEIFSELHSMLRESIRYYDDFGERYRHIIGAHADCWELECDGRRVRFDYSSLSPGCRIVFKLVAQDMLGRLNAISVCVFMDNLLRRPGHLMVALSSSPADFRSYWVSRFSGWKYHDALACRVAIHSLCNLSICSWSPGYSDFVGLLPSPKQDLYKTIRNQECFIPLDQQSLVVAHFDELAEKFSIIKSNAEGGFRGIGEELVLFARDACVAILSHQYAFRPGQIARIKACDVRFLAEDVLHISIPVGKQRKSEARRLVTRRVKREWAVIFEAFNDGVLALNKRLGMSTQPLFFHMTPSEVSIAVSTLMEALTGERWVPTDLRHSAAQRLADAGAARSVLAEFLGHATTLTGNYYYESSPAQAEKINQALMVSPIYSKIAEVARTKMIDKEFLMRMPSDNQIGAVPHGIPIAGIGSCQAGQSLCSKNPVLSCYSCRKFLPLADPAVHEGVVESLRPIVLNFANASRNNEESPAFTQLKRFFQSALTIAEEARQITIKAIE